MYCTTGFSVVWASSRENLSSGFATKVDSNRPAQLQRLARGLKIWLYQVEVLYYPGSKQQNRWSDCADAQADVRLCCSHMAWTGFLMTWLVQFLCLLGKIWYQSVPCQWVACIKWTWIYLFILLHAYSSYHLFHLQFRAWALNYLKFPFLPKLYHKRWYVFYSSRLMWTIYHEISWCRYFQYFNGIQFKKRYWYMSINEMQIYIW